MSSPKATDSKEPLSGPQPCEARLVEEARLGNRESFGQLVLRYERRLLRVILQLVHRRDVAEDLAQETFLRAYQRLDQFDPGRRFGPWLFQIGVNLTLDHLRRQKRRGWWLLFSERDSERPVDPGVDDPRESLDTKQEVNAVLQQLPEAYRTVLILRDLENFSTSEIAAILKRTESTIRWRLSEARAKFQEIWQRRQENGLKGSAAESSADAVAPQRNSRRRKSDE
jgi:RNA polymerase sigma-70 factor, ECF subfamily